MGSVLEGAVTGDFSKVKTLPVLKETGNEGSRQIRARPE
jgi:hypothetical protein